MIIVESVIGNANQPQWRDRLEGANIDWLMLDQWEAQKSRLRKSTAQDVELALSLDRNTICMTETFWSGATPTGGPSWHGSSSRKSWSSILRT